VGQVWTGVREDTQRNQGDQSLFNVAAEHKVGSGGFKLVGEINGQYEGRATQSGATVPTSGATVISLTPGLQYVPAKRGHTQATFEAGVQIPVVKHGYLPAIQDYQFYVGGYVVF
jgi:hypothetical protein